MEIEINFRFDEHGRTANTKVNGETNGENTTELDYGFKAEMTDLKEWIQPESSSSSSLSPLSVSKTRLDEILLDCEISDNLIMPRTYWMPADGKTQPRCALERFALDVFEHHVPSQGFDYDPATSGAEWWCQLRPSPETGRHRAVQKKSCGDAEEEDAFSNGISFHVDKDEELRILTGGSTYVHPHLSTITYLTNLGSPTLMMDCQVHPLTGEWMVPEDTVQGFVSWPLVGKHTSFDGRYLHASPPDLMGDKDAFAQQLDAARKANGIVETESSDAANANASQDFKLQTRRCRRVTFLVNIWLNYKPYDVHPFPESMIDKMSGRDEASRTRLTFGKPLPVQDTRIRSDQATEVGGTTSYTAPKFVWPLGDQQSGERLECRVPLQSIRGAAEQGGNVRIQWDTTPKDAKDGDHVDCFRLFDGKSSSATTTAATATATTATNASPTSVNEIKDESKSTSSTSPVSSAPTAPDSSMAIEETQTKSGTKMNIIHGDLLDLASNGKFDVIVHGCNCFNTMGAGIAKSIKHRWPAVYKADAATEKGSRDKLGTFTQAVVRATGRDGKTRPLVVVNAYTQYHWKHGIHKPGQPHRCVDYDAVRSVFSKIKKSFAGKRIGYPLIGAGLAGGSWDILSNIIETELNGEDHTLVKYVPPK